ncbi:DUF6115 domain-containing protein [Camelliibacillus cellulosilyticus]
MLTVLIIFSLCLHLVSFYLITIMSQKINLLKAEETEREAKMEEAMAKHLAGIREENERFIARLDEAIIHKTATGGLPDNDGDHTDQISINGVADSNDIEDHLEQSVVSRVLYLFDKGEKPEAIAKRLDIGKGEVDLMLKLHQKSSNG